MNISQEVITILTSYVEIYGILGVFVFMLLESALIPIPSEITMPFAGFLASRGLISFWQVVITGTIANLIGSVLTYYLGYIKGERWVVRFINRWGYLILLKEHEFIRAKKWLHKYGSQVSFFSRLLPVVRTYISLPAGIAKINFWKFSVLTLLGSFVWSFFLAYIGLELGQNWYIIEPYFRSIQIFIALVLIILFTGFFWKKIKK